MHAKREWLSGRKSLCSHRIPENVENSGYQKPQGKGIRKSWNHVYLKIFRDPDPCLHLVYNPWLLQGTGSLFYEETARDTQATGIPGTEEDKGGVPYWKQELNENLHTERWISSPSPSSCPYFRNVRSWNHVLNQRDQKMFVFRIRAVPRENDYRYYSCN